MHAHACTAPVTNSSSAAPTLRLQPLQKVLIQSQAGDVFGEGVGLLTASLNLLFGDERVALKNSHWAPYKAATEWLAKAF